MRRLIALSILALLACTACKRRPDEAPPEVPVDLMSSFDVSDPKATVQMTRGFYALEGATWRWAAPQFTVVLARPAAGPLHLELKLTVPEVVVSQTGPVTLSAAANGADLGPQTFTTAGDHLYAADFTPSGDRPAVTIEFSADKHVQPGGEDNRELSVIVTRVELTAK